MDNLCLVGLGLFGLLYLTSKKDKKLKEIAHDDDVFIDHTGNKTDVTMAFMKNKYRNGLEWVIPENEISCPTHPFAGFDYLKLSTDPQQPPVFGRYIKSLPQSLKMLLEKLEPTVVIGNTISREECGEWTLVTCSNNFPTISAITIYFAENINDEELSICKMKSIYKKMVKNYTCKKTIEPPIDWYNQSLWDDNSYLYLNLCGEGDTSTLETSEVLDTELLDNSDTSNVDDNTDITSMDNETELDTDAISETSVDNQSELNNVDDTDKTSEEDQSLLDKFIDSITSDNSNITSKENQEELDKIVDTITSKELSDPKLLNEKSSSDIILSDTSNNNSSDLDVISATSYDGDDTINSEVKPASVSPKK